MLGQQHPVAEHVAGHVADPDDGELVGLGVDPELLEVALDRLPRALGGDPERLVVVARRAAGGERVVEPEAVLVRDPVGGVAERRGALVGGDDQVRVVAVAHAHARRLHDLAVDQVVGDRQQRADERDVVALHVVAALDVEAALRARGHDHGVLGHLRAHQPEDLGAVVLAVRPAQAAAGDRPAAQVDALDVGRVDVDLHERRRLRHRRHVGGAQLEGQRLAVGVVGVRAQRRVDHRQLVAQDAVVVERGDLVEVGAGSRRAARPRPPRRSPAPDRSAARSSARAWP